MYGLPRAESKGRDDLRGKRSRIGRAVAHHVILVVERLARRVRGLLQAIQPVVGIRDDGRRGWRGIEHRDLRPLPVGLCARLRRQADRVRAVQRVGVRRTPERARHPVAKAPFPRGDAARRGRGVGEYHGERRVATLGSGYEERDRRDVALAVHIRVAVACIGVGHE